jgi:hypothetical protein
MRQEQNEGAMMAENLQGSALERQPTGSARKMYIESYGCQMNFPTVK